MIAGGGFAVMAWDLAISRIPHASRYVRYGVDRAHIDCAPGGCFPVHRAYYRILDNAWAEWETRSLVGCETVLL